MAARAIRKNTNNMKMIVEIGIRVTAGSCSGTATPSIEMFRPWAMRPAMRVTPFRRPAP
jgi:hypothetical protein